VGSYVLNKRAKFGAKIFTHFWEIAVFLLGRFILTHPVEDDILLVGGSDTSPQSLMVWTVKYYGSFSRSRQTGLRMSHLMADVPQLLLHPYSSRLHG